MVVVDPGHSYLLEKLDTHEPINLAYLEFVKRDQPAHMYPGNKGHHPGTTSQEVMRALLDRSKYVQNQFWCVENMLVTAFLQMSIWLLEFRAARRHGRLLKVAPWHIHEAKKCKTCGHVGCKEECR